MSEIKRKNNESFEGFMRRVKDQWKKSGILLQARKVQYFKEGQSKNMRRTQAVARSQKFSKLNYLRKTGKLPQTDDARRR